MKIIFDYNRTLFDPNTDSLLEGVAALLHNLSDRHELFLVSRREPGREARFEALGIRNYFKAVMFTDGKNEALFAALVGGDTHVAVVGDRVREEIAIGNRLGFTTIWMRRDKFADELPRTPEERPDHTAYTISDIARLLTLIANEQ